MNGQPVLGREHIWDAQWSTIDNDVQNIGFDIKTQLNDTWSLNTGYNYQDFVRKDIESFPKFNNYRI